MTVQTFSQRSEVIAGDFLQTVVVLDDQAFFQPRPEKVSELKEPPLRMAESTNQAVQAKSDAVTSQSEGGAEEIVPSEKSADPSSEPDAVSESHDLYAKVVIDSFGKKGLICSVFRPEQEENATDDFLPALRRADLVVLDWIIHKDDGKTALSAIKKLTQGNGNSERRTLRLIAVYTGQNDLREIAKRIRDSLGEGGINASLSDQDCTVNAPATTICVFAKPDVEVATDLKGRVIPFEKLPSKLIQEFAKATCGLIPNLLLSALSALRQSTHMLLHQLNKDLDAAFLSHQCLLAQPEDARHLALELVADEFRAIMDEYGVLESMSKEAIESWLSEKHPNGLTITLPAGSGTKTQTFTIEQAYKLLENGFGAEKGSLQLANSAKNSLTRLFLETEDDAQNLDNHFAMLTSCKSRYKLEQPIPMLTLGTIVSFGEGQDKKFLVCILPVCDSVRLKEARSFPFLPLTIDASKVFFVARHNDAFLNLRLNDAPFEIVMKSFKPTANDKVIKAFLTGETYQFTAEDGTVFTWIGELKFAQAQRVIFDFAARIGRVGLDESEWLREKRNS